MKAARRLSQHMPHNYKDLLDRAKRGSKLTDNELEAIRTQLATGVFEADPYTLLHIIGKAGDITSLPTVWKYIDFDTGNSEEDDMVRRIALQVVGRMWGIPEAFEAAVSKAFEDPSPYVRSEAATIVGFLGSRYPKLKKTSARALLRGLAQKNTLDDYVWSSFYHGLLELLEIPPNEWPSPFGRLKETDIRQDLIEKTKVLARNAGDAE